MKIEYFTIALAAIIILLIISAYYSPETPEIKKEEPKFIIVEEKNEPEIEIVTGETEPVIEEMKAITPKEAVIKVKKGFFDPDDLIIEKRNKCCMAE